MDNYKNRDVLGFPNSPFTMKSPKALGHYKLTDVFSSCSFGTSNTAHAFFWDNEVKCYKMVISLSAFICEIFRNKRALLDVQLAREQTDVDVSKWEQTLLDWVKVSVSLPPMPSAPSPRTASMITTNLPLENSNLALFGPEKAGLFTYAKQFGSALKYGSKNLFYRAENLLVKKLGGPEAVVVVKRTGDIKGTQVIERLNSHATAMRTPDKPLHDFYDRGRESMLLSGNPNAIEKDKDGKTKYLKPPLDTRVQLSNEGYTKVGAPFLTIFLFDVQPVFTGIPTHIDGLPNPAHAEALKEVFDGSKTIASKVVDVPCWPLRITLTVGYSIPRLA